MVLLIAVGGGFIVRDFFCHTNTRPGDYGYGAARLEESVHLQTSRLYRININTADAQRLMQVPGIGAKTAEKIIAFRGHNGFNKPEDLLTIPGIGETRLKKIEPFICME